MTDVVAWSALAMSALALIWQVVTWVRSGPRIKFSAMAGDMVIAEGKMTLTLFFTVTNSGRLAATVHSVCVDQRMGRLSARTMFIGPGTVRALDGAPDSVLPRRLEPHDGVTGTASWQFVPLQQGRSGHFGYLVPYAYVGDRMVTARLIRTNTVSRNSRPQ
ncbi:hypothetical protein ACIHDR_43060 [Nocardia sp. NPDC052278]|uniref:hypothetical protein n=1 Tax=unclassified Nocardia TaxID=2637762 RepID=UPI0036D1FE90